MPILDTMIPEATKQIIEPISTQIANRLLSVLGIWEMFKDNLHIGSDNLKTGNFDSDDGNIRVIEDRCDVKIIPDFNPLAPAMGGMGGVDTEVHSTTKRWIGGPIGDYPIFSDHRPNVYLYEVDTPCSVTLEFEIRSKSVEASDLINTSIFSKSMTGGSIYDTSEVLYSYPIPHKLILLLYHIYKLQDSINTALTFQEYLTAGSDSKMRVLLNRYQLDEGDKQLIIERTHSNIIGKLEYDGNKPEAENTNKVVDRYLTTFSYIFQFSKPTILKLEYPIMINNTMISTRYIKRPLNMSIGEVKQYHPRQAIDKYFVYQNKCIDIERSYPLVRYPEYDDWQRPIEMYRDAHLKYIPRFIGLMSIDIDNANVLSLSVNLQTEIFPLLDAATVAAIEAVLAIDPAGSRFQSSTDIFRRLSIFDISIFANDLVVPFNFLSIDVNKVLHVTAPLNKEKRYRVVISQISDLRYLNQEYIYFMLEHPEYYFDLLAYHLKYLIDTNYVKVIRDQLTNGVSVHSQQKNLQHFEYHPGPHPSITLGRYVVSVNPYNKGV